MNQVLEEVLQENCCPKTCQKGQKFLPLSDDIGYFCQTCLGDKSSTRDLLFEKEKYNIRAINWGSYRTWKSYCVNWWARGTCVFFSWQILWFLLQKIGKLLDFFFLVWIQKHLVCFWEKNANFFDITKLKRKRKTLMPITISHTCNRRKITWWVFHNNQMWMEKTKIILSFNCLRLQFNTAFYVPSTSKNSEFWP
jgi:hypothetical protein